MDSHPVSDTQIEDLLDAANAGDTAARDELFVAFYADLHRMAQNALKREGGDLSINPTTLLHDAYLDMSGRLSAVFPDRARFLAYAARAMRSLIIDYARNRCAQKRGHGFHITSLPTEAGQVADDVQLQRIAEAVEALAVVEPRLAQVVNLKFFCGYSFTDIADIHGVSARTVRRDWEKARLYLHNAITES